MVQKLPKKGRVMSSKKCYRILSIIWPQSQKSSQFGKTFLGWIFQHCVRVQTWMSFVLVTAQNIRLRLSHPGNRADHHIGKTEEYIYVDVDSNRAWLKSGWDLGVDTWIDREHNRGHPHLGLFHCQKYQNPDLQKIKRENLAWIILICFLDSFA